MSELQVQNRLDAPHVGNASPLYPLISSKIRFSQGLSRLSEDTTHLWSAEWWGLPDCGFYNALSSEIQNNILYACNRTILNEAYFIEKSGLAYSAKMVLLAESTDVAQLYAFIGADEARHLAWLEPYVAEEDKTRPYGEFLAFLSRLIEEAPPRLLVYLVQIILEGWGLDHYKRLADGCQQNQLKDVFLNILKDEALHHKSGSLLFKPAKLQSDDLKIMREAMIAYANMVRIGRWTIVMAIEHIVGKLSVDEVKDVLIALKHFEESHRKLQLLKSLMRQPGMEMLVDELEAAGVFASLAPQEAAEVYVRCH